ncbi:MAG TPA: 2'-5' RNA ligase family protein [Acidimicrobiia bacterium]|nr:2'-5' RNA ligase family protein [Acidimicrobiia bacterium]
MPRRYLLLALTGEAAERVQRMRREWDPVMAERISPHLTLIYPQEVDNEELLLQRVAEVASRTAPFDVRPGRAERSNLGGVWLRVVDESGTWSRLRATILTPPFAPYPVTPHVTIVHPRTSPWSSEALAAMNGAGIEQTSQLDEIIYTETGRRGTKVLERFQLEGING